MPSKKPKSEPVVAAPIQTYGCPVQGKDQFFYDRWHSPIVSQLIVEPRAGWTCSRASRKAQSEILRMAWVDRTGINSACEYRWVAFSGCSGSAKLTTSLDLHVHGGCVLQRFLRSSSARPLPKLYANAAGRTCRCFTPQFPVLALGIS